MHGGGITWWYKHVLLHRIPAPQGCVRPLGGRVLLPSPQRTAAAGSARAVNRRYIAMFVAREQRTWASAVFVSLSAVGMALGPLLALPLARAPTTRLAGAFPVHGDRIYPSCFGAAAAMQ